MNGLEVETSIAFEGFRLDFAHRFAGNGITALFGPSGCGKTTLLRIIAGLEKSAQGRVSLGGETWQDTARGIFTAPHRRRIGYVFQEARLFPHLDVRANLAYADKRSGGPGSGSGGPITMDGVIETLDLGGLVSRRAQTLSGGERQRVAIARALLTRPRLMLMDEPLSALDIRRKGAIVPYIERLPRQFGIPVLYVTHAVDEAARLADDMVVIAEGRKLAHGAPAAMLARLDLQPAVGNFEAGSLLDAVVTKHDLAFHLTHLDCNGQELVMPHADIAPGETVRVRIRARDVALATARPKGISIRNILSGTIAEIVEEQDTAFAETVVDIAGGASVRARITRASVAELGLAPGRKVFALVKTVTFDRRAL